MSSMHYKNSALSLEKSFRNFVARPSFPCVGAKSAVAKHQVEFFHGRDITSAWNDIPLLQALQKFARNYRRNRALFSSFVAIFKTPLSMSESAFEAALWDRVQSLHDKESWQRMPYDRTVSSDPASDDFGLSIGGSAFFIVGLHPRASRKARRFTCPTLVFNLHDQFEQLRADGRYEPMRAKIIERDCDWSGSVNPMLARHGSVSEARQYSGRAVNEDWVCPFKPRGSSDNGSLVL